MDEFIKALAAYKGMLTKQEISTLRGQAISGDLRGAEKGLARCVRRHLLAIERKMKSVQEILKSRDIDAENTQTPM